MHNIQNEKSVDNSAFMSINSIPEISLFQKVPRVAISFDKLTVDTDVNLIHPQVEAVSQGVPQSLGQ